MLRSSPEHSFVAELNGSVIGFVSCTVSPPMRMGRIVDLAVDSDHRRRGVASGLIERSLRNFRANGMAIAKIETLEKNDAGRRLYPRFGFREVATQIHYMMDLESPEDGL